MKKLLLSFVLGIGLFSVSQAQINQQGTGAAITVGGQPVFVNGVAVNGNAQTGVNSAGNPTFATQTLIGQGSIITFMGQTFRVIVTPVPVGQQGSNAILAAFINGGVQVSGPNSLGSANQNFGTEAGENFTLVLVPFDFGISAVLGAGALGAIRTARRRKKEQELVTA